LIQLLIKRGSAITSKQEDFIIQYEEQIKALKPEQYYTKICGAFIIFDDFSIA